MSQSKKILLQITIISAFLSVISMPEIIKKLEPFWLLLFFFYWLIYVDDNHCYRYALSLGFFIDLLQSNILGQGALAIVLSTFIILNLKKSFHISNKISKQIYIFLVSVVYLLIFLAVDFIIYGFYFDYIVMLSIITTNIFWPIIYIFMKNINKKIKK